MRSKHRRALVCVLASLPLLVTATRTAISAGSAAKAAPRVDAAWIRWLPGTIPAAGYLTLTNLGDEPVTLLSATSPDFGEISLHRTQDRGGQMNMQGLDRITLAAHTTWIFESTGYHLMLMQPGKSVRPGAHVTITLRFAETAPVPVDFEVRNPDGSRVAPSARAGAR